MDRAALVGPELEIGRKIVDALDKAGRPVDVAMWADLPEYDDWRLVVASRKFNDPSLRAGYRDLLRVLDREGVDFHERSAILLQRMEDTFIKELRRRYQQTVKNEGFRIRSEHFGNQYVGDAYVYRIR